MKWNSKLLLLLIAAIITTSDSQSRQGKNGGKGSKVLKVTTIQNKPFLMLKENEKSFTGNDRYEGFIPDLLQELSKLKSFEYEIKEVSDNRYGNRLDNGSWTGMLGEIIQGDADIAAADMTITFERAKAIDFTIPFMSTGLGILTKRSGPPVIDPWLFIKPFSLQVWLCIIIAFFGVAVFLYILGRFSRAEWHETNSVGIRENNLRFTNSLYFVFASLFFQNSKIAPRGAAPRLLSCIWWAFSFFILCCYIANLAALFVNKMDGIQESSEIANVEVLARQNKVKYGMLKGGSTYNFFSKSKLPLYQLMYDVMVSADPSVFVNSYAEGVDRVRQGNYAIFMESTTISYLIAHNCEFTQIGGLLDSRLYGLAFNKSSKLTQEFSEKILKLHEDGIILKLRDKWWSKGSQSSCTEEDEEDTQGSLSMSSIRGVFILLLIGFILALLVAILELFWRIKNSEGSGPLCNEFIQESKNALCGSGPSHVKMNGKRSSRREDGRNLEKQSDTLMA